MRWWTDPKAIGASIGSVFMYSATIAGLVVLNHTAWMLTAIPTATVASFFLWYSIARDNHGKVCGDITKALNRFNKEYMLRHRDSVTLQVRPLQNEGEVRANWDLDMELYGPTEMIDYELYLSWWRKYNRGAYALFRDSEIIGAVGLWPLKRQPFVDLISGSRPEDRLVTQSICAEREASNTRYWYVAGIVLDKKYRGVHQDALRFLLSEAVQQWLQVVVSQNSLDICALAYSPQGEQMLRGFRFVEYMPRDKTIHRYPVYVRMRTTARDLMNFVHHVVPDKQSNQLFDNK